MRNIKKVFLTVALAIFSLAIGLFAACGSETPKSKLTFMDGTTTIEVIEDEVGAAVTAPDAPEKEGYTFDGWYSDAAHTEKATVPATMPEEEMTFYAGYTQYPLLSLDPDGGELETRTYRVAPGANLGEFLAGKEPHKEGLVFGGWFDGSEEVTDSTVMPAGGLSLTARWKAEITVEYYKQNATGDEFTLDPELGGKTAYFVGASVTVTPAEIDNFEFDADRSDPLTGITAEAGGATVKLYYIRVGIGVYYYANKPASASEEPSGEVPAQSARFEGTIEISENAFELEGYEFLGWAEEPLAGAESYVPAGTVITVDAAAVAAGNIRLYAQWGKIYRPGRGAEGNEYVVVEEYVDANGVSAAWYAKDGERTEGDCADGALTFGETAGAVDVYGTYLLSDSGVYERRHLGYNATGAKYGSLALTFDYASGEYNGTAVYTDENGEEISGTYYYERADGGYTGDYLFEGSDGSLLRFRLEGEAFLLQGKEARADEQDAYYSRMIPALDSLYYDYALVLDGFGGATVYLSAETDSGEPYPLGEVLTTGTYAGTENYAQTGEWQFSDNGSELGDFRFIAGVYELRIGGEVFSAFPGYVMYEEETAGKFTGADGELELNGYGTVGVYTDSEGVEHRGTYYVGQDETTGEYTDEVVLYADETFFFLLDREENGFGIEDGYQGSYFDYLTYGTEHFSVIVLDGMGGAYVAEFILDADVPSYDIVAVGTYELAGEAIGIFDFTATDGGEDFRFRIGYISGEEEDIPVYFVYDEELAGDFTLIDGEQQIPVSIDGYGLISVSGIPVFRIIAHEGEKVTITDGDYYYVFRLDVAAHTLTRNSSAEYAGEYLRYDGQYVFYDYIALTEDGAAKVYEYVNGDYALVGEGTYSVGENGIITFTPGEGYEEACPAFEFILTRVRISQGVVDVYMQKNESLAVVFDGEEGSAFEGATLELDGFQGAVYTAPDGTEFEGIFEANYDDEGNLTLIVLELEGGSLGFFEVDAEALTFYLLGDEFAYNWVGYGDYADYMVRFDGHDGACLYIANYDSLMYEPYVLGTYEIVDYTDASTSTEILVSYVAIFTVTESSQSHPEATDELPVGTRLLFQLIHIEEYNQSTGSVDEENVFILAGVDEEIDPAHYTGINGEDLVVYPWGTATFSDGENTYEGSADIITTDRGTVAGAIFNYNNDEGKLRFASITIGAGRISAVHFYDAYWLYQASDPESNYTPFLWLDPESNRAEIAWSMSGYGWFHYEGTYTYEQDGNAGHFKAGSTAAARALQSAFAGTGYDFSDFDFRIREGETRYEIREAGYNEAISSFETEDGSVVIRYDGFGGSTVMIDGEPAEAEAIVQYDTDDNGDFIADVDGLPSVYCVLVAFDDGSAIYRYDVLRSDDGKLVRNGNDSIRVERAYPEFGQYAMFADDGFYYPILQLSGENSGAIITSDGVVAIFSYEILGENEYFLTVTDVASSYASQYPIGLSLRIKTGVYEFSDGTYQPYYMMYIQVLEELAGTYQTEDGAEVEVDAYGLITVTQNGETNYYFIYDFLGGDGTYSVIAYEFATDEQLCYVLDSEGASAARTEIEAEFVPLIG